MFERTKEFIKKLNILLTTALLFSSLSCSAYRDAGNFGGCFPDGEKTSLREKAKNYVAGADTVYSIQQKSCPYTKDNQLRIEIYFMRKD